MNSVADPHPFDADPDPACHFDADADPDPAFHFDAVPDPDSSFKINAQNLEKGLKYAHFPYILPCHLQTDADPDLVLSFNLTWFYADPDPDPQHLMVDKKNMLVNIKGVDCKGIC